MHPILATAKIACMTTAKKTRKLHPEAYVYTEKCVSAPLSIAAITGRCHCVCHNVGPFAEARCVKCECSK